MTDPPNPPAAAPLLDTKRHQPRPSALLVPRPRLLEALTAGLDRRLMLISAPAGVHRRIGTQPIRLSSGPGILS